MATTVVGYLRPPSAGDVDSRADHQALRRYAENRDLRLRHVYADGIGSAAVRGRRGERTGSAAALADVRERRADGVLLLDVAYLSWHPDLAEDAGGRLFVADDALDPALART